MRRALLIDDDPIHASRVSVGLSSRDLHVHCMRFAEAEKELRRSAHLYEIVIVNVSDSRIPWAVNVEKLQRACLAAGGCGQPSLLCTSTRHHGPQFELEMERRGARYVVER